MQLPQPGQMFEGKYAIRQKLGEGGFAMVYRATDEEIRRDVAIKILTPDEDGYREKVVARFMREARVIAGLQDPHTIKLFEFGESADGLLYMVFQYVSGLDLATIIKRRGPLPPEVVVHVTAQVLSALTEAHAAGILHRDIKPANILVHEYMGDEYSVKLLDFGIAKVEQSQGGASLTKTGAMIGTPRYMAPEQVFGERVGPWSDIYSLGLVTYEMLAGQPAIGGTKEQMLRAQVSDEPILLPYELGWLSLRQAIEGMLARAPAGRFQTASEAHKAFRFAMKHPHHPLPSGSLPASSISGPLPPLPYSSGTHVPSPGAFSSGFVTPNPDFSSHSFSGGYTSSGSVETASTRRGIVAAAVALAVVVGGVAVYLSMAAEPPPPPRMTDEFPSALIRVEEAAKTAAPESPPAGDTGQVKAEAEPEPPPEPVADGCGNEYTWQYERWMHVKSLGGDRAVQVFLPKTYKPKKRHAVIIALQPVNWDVKQYVNRAKLDSVAGEKGAIVLGPETDRLEPWTSASDLAVLKALVPAAASQFCVDRSRVFVVGTGAGARMARELMCQIPISAVATTGDGELSNMPSCVPTEPVPFLWIIGKKDQFAPMGGGPGCTGGDFLSADQHDQLWRGRYQCSVEPTRWLDRGGSTCWSWGCEQATYASCRAAGGHYLKSTRWDILDPPGCDAPVLRLPVGPTVWEFFETHGKRLQVPEPQ